MMHNVKNPFEYGGVVSGSAFCNREREVAELVRAMKNSEKRFVYSGRLYGKTSLVRAALGGCQRRLICAPMWTFGRPTARRVSYGDVLADFVMDKMLSSPETGRGPAAP